MKNFKWLTGDVNYTDYGGKWWRRADKGRYHIIELTNMQDACGDDAIHMYNVDLAEVDVLECSEAQIKSAMDSCGWDGIYELEGEQLELAIAEMLHGYGHKAPLGQWDGNNYKELMKEARALSRELDDPALHEEYMNRPVNRIGSTAREFMQGDFTSAMQRGVNANDPSAKLMAKLHGVPDAVIERVVDQAAEQVKTHGTDVEFSGAGVRANINLRKIPSDDPIAFMAGYMNGLSGRTIDQPGTTRDELAEAFIHGHRHGVEVREGDAERPEWHR